MSVRGKGDGAGLDASRGFQIFAKPTGAACNLQCNYCYYLKKKDLYPADQSSRMPDDILEDYIVQHIDASPDRVTRFSWHGGEPTVLGLDYFRKIVALERKHQPPGRTITNGMQTNGTLLDEDWCRFLAAEGFAVGLSLDGPPELHDPNRVTQGGKPTHEQAMRGYELLRRHRIPCDILCVVNRQNARYPTKVYRFFKQIHARYIGFLPLVEPRPDEEGGVSRLTVPAEALGAFLSTIFDEWLRRDIGRIEVQIFEEATRPARGLEHALCIFRETCGGVPVIEHNGDFFSCDHFVDTEHRLGNLGTTPLAEMLEGSAQRAFGRAKLDTLPGYCRACRVRSMCHGGCPKDRILRTPDGEAGLNYLCAGYKHFFTHCRHFVDQVAALSRGQPLDQAVPEGVPIEHKTGRNDPCPCGSGLKHKKCCLKI